jgi:hypothetical protein
VLLIFRKVTTMTPWAFLDIPGSERNPPSSSIFYDGGNNRHCCNVMVSVRASAGELKLQCPPEA